jgi:1-phosphofructokinase family hexose kinase
VLLCITPAPAIDRTAHVEHITHGEVLRPRQLVALPGGKGVNAARAASRLGGRVITTGVAGGHAGRWIVETLAREGLEPRWSPAAAESRTTYVTVDDEGDAVVVYERPATATDAEYAAFLRLLEDELLPICDRVIVAGSIPTGIDVRGHAAIVEVCRVAGRPLLVDAAGRGLVAALAAGPEIVKIGRIEVIEAGLADVEAGAQEAAEALLAAGARLAVVTDGARDVVAVDRTTTWRLGVPQVRVVNAVGSGDSFNAAMSLALIDGADVTTALVKGVAAGSANALSLGAAMLDPAVAHRMEQDVTITVAGR